MKKQVGSEIKQQRVKCLTKAKAVLDKDGNRLTLIVGILCCIMTAVSVLLMLSAIYEAVPFSSFFDYAEVAVLFGSVQMLLSFFLVFPLYLGVLRTAGKMCRGEPVAVTSFFEYYRSFSALWRAWGIQLRIFWRALPILIVIASGYVPLFIDTAELYNALTIVIWSVSPLLLIWGFFSTSRLFAFAPLAVCDDSSPLGTVAKQAKQAARKKMGRIFAMRLRMLVGLILSLLSVGVITLIHTMPLTLLAYSELANELADADTI